VYQYFILLSPNSIPFTDMPWFAYPFICWIYGLLPVLAITNETVMNIHVQVFVLIFAFIALE
jgi:hypothetical protein